MRGPEKYRRSHSRGIVAPGLAQTRRALQPSCCPSSWSYARPQLEIAVKVRIISARRRSVASDRSRNSRHRHLHPHRDVVQLRSVLGGRAPRKGGCRRRPAREATRRPWESANNPGGAADLAACRPTISAVEGTVNSSKAAFASRHARSSSKTTPCNVVNRRSLVRGDARCRCGSLR